MAVADDLERARAALRMVNEAPFNAEAPPEALTEEITPTGSRASAPSTKAATPASRIPTTDGQTARRSPVPPGG